MVKIKVMKTIVTCRLVFFLMVPIISSYPSQARLHAKRQGRGDTVTRTWNQLQTACRAVLGLTTEDTEGYPQSLV